MRKCVRKMVVRSPVLILDCPVPARRRILTRLIGLSTCPSDMDRKASLTIVPALSILDQQSFTSRQVGYFVTMTIYRLCAQSQTSHIDAYDRYRNATNATYDSDTNALRVPRASSRSSSRSLARNSNSSQTRRSFRVRSSRRSTAHPTISTSWSLMGVCPVRVALPASSATHSSSGFTPFSTL
jgi:hypothetical protein